MVTLSPPTALAPALGAAPARRRPHWRVVLVAPAVVFLVALFALPVARIVLMSVNAPALTLQYYIQFFTVPVYAQVLYLTFKVALIVTVVCFILAYPVAYLLASVKPATARLLLILVLLPFWVSLLVRTYAWMVILGRAGLINQVLMNIGLIQDPLPLIFNTFAVVVAMSHILLPFMVLPLYSVMRGIDRRLLHAAASLGAKPWRAFVTVFLPLSLPGVGAGCLLVFIQSIGFFITPSLVGGAGDVMIAQLIENQVRQLVNWPFASAQAVVLLVSAAVVLALFNRVLGLERIWSSNV